MDIKQAILNVCDNAERFCSNRGLGGPEISEDFEAIKIVRKYVEIRERERQTTIEWNEFYSKFSIT